MKALISLLALLFAHPAFASSCVSRSAEENFRAADVVFLGKIVGRKPVTLESSKCWPASAEKPACGGKLATFEVQKTWKGAAGPQISVQSEDACLCLGSYFTEGKEYIVFAHGKDTALTTGVCEGTTKTDSEDAQNLIEFLNRERP